VSLSGTFGDGRTGVEKHWRAVDSLTQSLTLPPLSSLIRHPFTLACSHAVAFPHNPPHDRTRTRKIRSGCQCLPEALQARPCPLARPGHWGADSRVMLNHPLIFFVTAFRGVPITSQAAGQSSTPAACASTGAAWVYRRVRSGGRRGLRCCEPVGVWGRVGVVNG
jgi:hypothetical protein